MGRLSKILERARVAEANLETAVERDVARYIERVAEVDRRREDTFLAKHMSLDDHVSDLAEFKEDLEAFGKNERPGGEHGNAYAGTGGKNDKKV